MSPWRVAAALLLVPALCAAQPEPSGPPPEAKGWRAVKVASGIAHPWGIAWLPDGRPLVTAREGKLFTLRDGKPVEIPLKGSPRLFAQGQGGLLDIAVHPAGGKTPRVYMTASLGTEKENRTALLRGVFDGKTVGKIETLFEVQPNKSGAQHFGSRILWLPDGTLLMSVGDGGNPPARVGDMLAREQAQNLRSHLGSVVRLTHEGKPAPGNPFVERKDALPALWSYGHRNIQGLARDPRSGRLWATEHGPLGGDELNLLEAGRNHGWPLQTQGRDYRTGEPIGQKSVEGAVDPKVVWSPAHGPSGLAFYTGDGVKAWQGSLFSGGLASQDIRRIILDGEGAVVRQERLSLGRRVREVRQGPDGFLYVLTDEKDGQVLRLEAE
jgi:glucose/arabinose dehydrogenase